MSEGPHPRPNPVADFFEFGPFRLESETRSLYRDGEFISVTPKALDILFVLVEDAGKLVTKDELMQRVWPDSFVEEGSIANQISILRKLLNPYFEGDGPITTVARRGYRFTEPVTLRNAKAGISLHTESGRLTPEAAEAIADYVKAHESRPVTAPLPPVPSAEGRGSSPARKAPVLIAAVAVLAIAVFGVASMMRPAPSEAAVGTRRSVAVLPMKNLSGDESRAWLSMALAETISAELAGGNQFRVVSGESIARLQQEMAPPAGVGLTRKQLDDIGRDLACDLILTGNFIVAGGKIRIDVRLDEVATGSAIVTTTITDDEAKFLDIVSQAGSEMRAKLGADPSTQAQSDALRATFTASPEALRNYFQGLEALRQRDGPRARDFLEASVKAEDNFALAHSALSTTWRLLGYDKRGAESAKRAFDLSANLSHEDRLGVEAQYHEATGSWPKAIEFYQQLWKSYPDNIEYGLKLGNAQWLGGKTADVLMTVEQMRKLPERDSRDPRIDLIECTAADTLGDVKRAVAAASRAAEKATAAHNNLLLARARIKQGIYAYRLAKYAEAAAFMREAEQLFAKFNEIGGVADALRWQALLESDQQHAREAVALLDRAYAMVAPLDYVRLRAAIESAIGVAQRQLGDYDQAVKFGALGVLHAREAGDSSLITPALLNYGTAQRFHGDYAAAGETLRQAVTVAEASGNIRDRNASMNNSAVIDFLLGDLAEARKKHTTILEFDRSASGSPAGLALRLGNLSRVIALQDEIVEAEKLTAEECRIYEGLKAGPSLAWCRTRLAELWLELGRKADAQKLLAPIDASQLGTASNIPVYIARLARVQLNLGNLAAAAETIAASERLQQKAGPVFDQQLQVSTVNAEIDAAQGKRAAAIAQLQKVIADANRAHLLTFELDARLALSRLDPKTAPATIEAAKKAGFNQIARKAAAISKATS